MDLNQYLERMSFNTYVIRILQPLISNLSNQINISIFSEKLTPLLIWESQNMELLKNPPKLLIPPF